MKNIFNWFRNDKNIVKLPPYTVQQVVSILSQTMDWGITKTNIPETWKTTRGENVTVMVLDTGYTDHVDLQGAMIVDKCITTIGGDKIDRKFHSGHVCGIIGARDNDFGCVGVAPECKIITVKVLGDNGTGSHEAIIKGLEYATIIKPDIINMSLGASAGSEAFHKAIKKCYDLGIVLCAAVGNEGTNSPVNYPAKYPECIAVAAYAEDGKIANFSCAGTEVFISAPGKNIYSTYGNNTYALLSGTCLTKNVNIYTTKGPKKINDLSLNDYVYSYNLKTSKFEPKRILKMWSNGVKAVKEIKSNRTSIQCTDNHPILCLVSDNLTWKAAGMLKVGDMIVTNNSRLNNDNTQPTIDIAETWYTAVSQPLNVTKNDIGTYPKSENHVKIWTTVDFLNKKYGVMYKKIKETIIHYCLDRKNLIFSSKCHSKIELPEVNEDLAYLLGFYIGDGWISKYKPRKSNESGRCSVICFARGDNETVNKNVCDIFEKIFHRKLTYNNSGMWYYCYDTMICEIIEQLSCHQRACEKTLPSWLFTTTEQNVYAFLSGYIDADGHKTGAKQNRAYGITTCSEKLINGLICLLDYFNIHHSNMTHRKRTAQPPHSPKAIVSENYECNLSILPENFYGIKKNTESTKRGFNCKFLENNPDIRLEKIIKISELEDQEVFDITVEDNHNFLANNIIVHNSMATPWVSGVLALLISKHKKQELITGKNDCKTVEQVKEHLRKYAINQGTIGKNNNWGWGIIDVPKLINAESTTQPVDPTPSPSLPVQTPHKSFWSCFKGFWKKLGK